MVSERKRRQLKHDYVWNENIEDKQQEKSTHFNKKKNTKKWCKGKVGVEHQPVIEVDRKRLYGRIDPEKACGMTKSYRYDGSYYWLCRHHEVCSTCGKELRWTIPADECPVRK